ncbi:MAG: hypothetical protein QOD96_23 [Pseudonocardiales bacterium]|nr:hypothetical protein [Pseudonocardiales bacterium]
MQLGPGPFADDFHPIGDRGDHRQAEPQPGRVGAGHHPEAVVGDDHDELAVLDGRVAKWWIPESYEFIDEVPKTSVGKFSKKTLREQFKDRQSAPAAP